MEVVMPTASVSATSVGDIVRRYFAAYASRNRLEFESLLSDDFTFTSPYDDHIGRMAYFERCWPVDGEERKFRIEKLFEKGNEAFVRYELEPGKGVRFRNTEHFTLEDGKIKNVDVYFGAFAA
jgi:ketosteroid isomerase-like protein